MRMTVGAICGLEWKAESYVTELPVTDVKAIEAFANRAAMVTLKA